MPEFLLSFYKPNIYTAIAIECRRSGADFDKGFKRVFKQSAADFVDELINSLSLPKEYISMTRALASPPWNRRWNPDDRDDTKAVVKGVYLANQLALKVFSFCNDEDGRAFVRELGAKSEDFATDDLFDTLEEIGSQLRESLDLIGVPQVRLPKFDIRNKPKGAEPDESPPPPAAPANISARLNPFLVELKVTLKSKVSEGEPGRIFQAAHCTLSALVHTLNFDRAYLMGDDGAGVMRLLLYYGPASPSGEAYVRKLDTKGREFLPDLLAHFERKTVFTGDPLFGDDWPFVCFPVVAAGKSLGVIYADRVADEKAQALSLEEQLAVTALAEQWQSIPSEFR